MTTAAPIAIDLDRLFRLRLVVGRFGEMDLARSWNCKGMLGRHRAVVLERGFPATHQYGRAHVVPIDAQPRAGDGATMAAHDERAITSLLQAPRSREPADDALNVGHDHEEKDQRR